MYGKATLEIPAVGDIGRSFTDGLSDQLATVMGLTAANTLPDDLFVTVTLGSGKQRVIRPNDVQHSRVIRRWVDGVIGAANVTGPEG